MFILISITRQAASCGLDLSPGSNQFTVCVNLDKLFNLSVPQLGFPGGFVVKTLPADTGRMGLIPGLGRSPEEGNGNPLQYSSLKDPRDRGT